MPIGYRTMEPRDAAACAEVIARHPILGPRYGGAIQHLAPAWLKLIGSDGFVAAVFEERQGAKSTILGAGIAAFVTDDFIRELKAAPHFWMGAELAARVCRNQSPLLSDEEVRKANSLGGLNVAVWQRGVLPEDSTHGEISNTIMAAFVELHRGFLIKDLVVQAETVQHVGMCRGTGVGFWNAREAAYRGFPSTPPEKIIREPHVIGMSRELAVNSPGAWASSLFLYKPPQLGFSRSEQRLIAHALAGQTDEQLAKELCVSLAAVRKAWRAIYMRVNSHLPELIAATSGRGEQASQRGKQKKHQLLAYLREHPEELRPVSRKLLRQNSIRLD
jgi:hypothetical protein